MRHPFSRARHIILVAVVPAALPLMVPAAGSAETVIPVGSFRSVTLRNGGEVIVRHGSSPRVTLLQGTTEYSKATIVDGDRLVIDRRSDRCPRGYRLAVEVLVPSVDDVKVMDGGTIRTEGSFPQQSELQVTVENGGTIDLRSMPADRVTAAVHSGGRIFTTPRATLSARIAEGGIVTYWGRPNVTSSVKDGGVVTRGAAADADKPLQELGTMGPSHHPRPARIRRGSA